MSEERTFQAENTATSEYSDPFVVYGKGDLLARVDLECIGCFESAALRDVDE